MFAGISSFVSGGSFWQEELACDGGSSPECTERSVFEPSYFEESYCERSGSVIDGSVIDGSVIERSVCEPSYFEPSYCEPSYYGESSVCEPSYFEGSYSEPSVFQGIVSGATAYLKRGPGQEVKVRAPAAAPVAARPVGGPYQARMEDKIDVEVAKYFKANPTVFGRNRGFTRISPGAYYANGREIKVELGPADVVGQLKGEKYQLMVKDGPLRQPLADYLDDKESSAEYSGSVFKAQNAVQAIPQGCRMTFCDAGGYSSRLEAMKMAKEQANVREKAATAMKHGRPVAPNLMSNYEKKVGKKGNSNMTQTLSFASNASCVSQTVTTIPTNSMSRRISIVR